MEYKRVTQDSARMRNNDATIPRCQCLSHNLVVTAGSSNCFIDDSFWECLLLVAVFQMLRFIFLCSYLVHLIIILSPILSMLIESEDKGRHRPGRPL